MSWELIEHRRCGRWNDRLPFTSMLHYTPFFLCDHNWARNSSQYGWKDGRRWNSLVNQVKQLCLFQFNEIFMLQWFLRKQYDCFRLVRFLKKSGRLSSASPEILYFGSYCSANFQPILHCFIPDFKLKYGDSENTKTGRVNTVIFNLHQIKQRNVFWDTQ